MIIFSHVKFKSGSLVSLEGGGEIPPVCLVLGAHCYKNDLCQLLFVVCCLLFVVCCFRSCFYGMCCGLPALKLEPDYLKVLLRRSQPCEELEKYEDALQGMCGSYKQATPLI